MTIKIKTTWQRMNERALVHHLTEKLKFPPPLVATIRATVLSIREQRRVEKIKATQCRVHWAHLVDPLRAELGIIRTLKSQAKRAAELDQAKWDALCRYESVVGATLEKLRAIEKNGTHTPRQFIAWLKKEGKRVPPNEGAHWTDWVPIATRQEIIKQFAGLKAAERGKAKTPFARTVSRKLQAQQRNTLHARIDTELANAEQLYEVTADEQEQFKLNDLIFTLHKARSILMNTKGNRQLPDKWQDLLHMQT